MTALSAPKALEVTPESKLGQRWVCMPGMSGREREMVMKELIASSGF